MAKPILTYSATSTDLPYPVDSNENPGWSTVSDVTLGGNSRIQKLHRKHIWTLSFEHCLKDEYDTINELWNDALDANAFPTFTFTEVFPDASAVQVLIEMTEFVPDGYAPEKGGFTITLTQAGSY